MWITLWITCGKGVEKSKFAVDKTQYYKIKQLLHK